MNDIKERVARGLLAIGAVFLRPEEPFTWASGIKSPIYCDNRLILTAPDVRNEVEAAIAETVRREFPEAEVLMGTATAGIAHAAIAAHLMGLPMGYVRSGAKDHGRQNRIEGKLTEGEKVVVTNLGHDIEQGTVVVVTNVLEEPIIKRVIATEGQTVNIDYDTGTVYIDGEALNDFSFSEVRALL